MGAIYVSTNNVNPGTLFGGTWTQIKDRFLLAAGDSYSSGSTGGTSTVTITVSQMPSHTHTFTGASATTGYESTNHTHTFTASGDVSGSSWYNSFASGSNQSGIISSTAGSAVAVNVHGTTAGRNVSHTHTISAKGSNSNTGGGGAHDNMPPYLAVYMWKRTA